MLLHAASLAIDDAAREELGRFNKCLSAMVMTALAVEALLNAVGSRVAEDWASYEKLRPHEKLECLTARLNIQRDPGKDPWSTLQFLAGFRNDIAHPKPELVREDRVLPEVGLNKTAFQTPLSRLEQEVTLGNAKRVYAAVQALKGALTDALPAENRFGIYADMWHGSTSAHVA